jgi:beta-1,4-N-acetylglucosaminyltransferase
LVIVTDAMGEVPSLRMSFDRQAGTQGPRSSPDVPADAREDVRADVMLVCSTGGHLMQLSALRDAWGDRSRAWVTFDKSDARSLLRGERVIHAYGPTNRSIVNLVRNLFLARRVVRRVRPRVMVTTGAGVAVPFAWLARLGGARVIYVESFTRIDGASLSCRLISLVADRTYVQWPELQHELRRASYAGNLFSGDESDGATSAPSLAPAGPQGAPALGALRPSAGP